MCKNLHLYHLHLKVTCLQDILYLDDFSLSRAPRGGRHLSCLHGSDPAMNTYLESITLPLCISLLDLDCRQGSIESSAGFIFPYFAGISFGRTRLHHSPEHRSLAVNTILQARSQVTRGASVVFTTGIFIVSDSAPRIVAVIALSEDINTRGCVQALKKSNEEIPSINENMSVSERPSIPSCTHRSLIHPLNTVRAADHTPLFSSCIARPYSNLTHAS